MKDEQFIRALTETFGRSTFTVHDVMDVLPQSTLPVPVRMALMGQGVLNTSGSRSLGLYLRKLDGVESLTRTGEGRVWRLNPDAKGHHLGQPAGTIVGRVGTCKHCLKPSRNLGQHERSCALKTVPAAPQPNTYVEEINHDPRP
ncbi:MAG: hypothetical protein ABW022_08200 [Actinoplanes sp.]